MIFGVMIFRPAMIPQRISGFKLSLTNITDDSAVFDVARFNVMEYIKLVHWGFPAHITNPAFVRLIPMHVLGDLIVQT